MSTAPHESYPSAPARAPQPAPAGTPLWASVAAAVTAVAALGTAVLAGVAVARLQALEKLTGERLTAVEVATKAIEDGARARAAVEYVTPDKIDFNCIATNTEVNCTATNRGTVPVATCSRGKLSKKQASAVAIYSLPMCTGRLGQFETKALSAPWKGAFAKDICSSKTSLGNEFLDFDQCDFMTEPVGAQQPAAVQQ